MTTSSGKCVGIDVSKDKLDVAVLWGIDRTDTGIGIRPDRGGKR